MRATRAGQSALLLLDVVEVLVREQLDYAVIGAFALSIYGAVRASTDVDALLQVPFDRLKDLQAAIRALGLKTSLHQGEAEDPVRGLLVINDAFGNQVDLLGGLQGLDPEIFSRTIGVPFADQVLRLAGREDFIAMKCFAGGPQDLLDARSAYDGAQGPIDLDLLRTVTRRFGRDAADRLESILGT
ncbi:MAG: hypothetical protein JSR36_15630 [Proteobacteria bacterium]|nr:hypothetical protein [Pseudomonadota bacterium]